MHTMHMYIYRQTAFQNLVFHIPRTENIYIQRNFENDILYEHNILLCYVGEKLNSRRRIIFNSSMSLSHNNKIGLYF